MYGHISFNRSAFNRTQENESTTWSGSAEAAASAEGILRLTKTVMVLAEALSSGEGYAGLISAMVGSADALATALSDWIRKVYLIGKADALSTGIAVGVYQMGTDSLVLEVDLRAGDELIIDTERMTAYLNNQNYVGKLSDDSTFFNLAKDDYITVSGNGTATVTLLWKDRWL